jgi:hypothetical protein
MGEKENSEFVICVNLRHLRAIPDLVAAGRIGHSRSKSRASKNLQKDG